ncbi:MAG: zf-HC2 domain-containing protein [Elusimicrobia bacterium]|nr:zf-HC2 domain-containing protein [Elusimicrobiota bacterium]
MNCKEARELLSASLDNETDNLSRLSLKEHLAGCPSCVEELKELQSVKNLLQEQPLMEMPPEIRRAIKRQADERLLKKPFWSWPRFVFKPALVFSFAGVLLVAGIWLYKDFKPKQEAVPLELFLAEHTRSLSKTSLARRTVAAASPYYSLQSYAEQ